MKYLFFIFCLYFSTAGAQLISKTESAAIDKLLADLSKSNKPSAYLIRNVNVLTMKDSIMIHAQNVLIRNGVIQEISSDAQDRNATVIDGTGKYLMPGLTDMHVHLFDRQPMKNTWLLMLLINGVTTVRDMCGEEGKISLREKIRKNEIIGPNLYQAGPVIDGKKDNMGLFALATNSQQGRDLVLTQKKAGYDFIKVYDGLLPEVYSAIADEAQKQGIQVVGHVPDRVTVDEAIQLKQSSIEHLNGYIEWKQYQVSLTAGADYASRAAKSELWNCPTIYNHFLNGSRSGAREMMAFADQSGLLPHGLSEHWKKIIGNNSKEMVEIVDKNGPANYEVIRKIVSELHRSGAKLVVGTDAGNLPLMIPGYSLHQEMRLMNELGVPVFKTLRMSTVDAAIAMNRQSEFGTIEEGKRADVLLLNSDPLKGLANLEDKAGLMVRGVWLPAEKIEEIKKSMQAAFKD